MEKDNIRNGSMNLPAEANAVRRDKAYVQGGNGSRKRKKKKKKTKGQVAMGCALYLILVIICALTFSFLAMTMANDMFALIKPPSEATIILKAGDSVSSAAKALKNEGVIENTFLFEIFAGLKDVDELKTGEILLSSDMPYSQILSKIKKSSTTVKEVVSVTIPEGYELSMIVELLVDKKVSTKENLMKTIEDYKFKHGFLVGMPERENRLEGYLFPDTYQFYVNDDPVQVINKLLNNFDKKFKQSYAERAKELGMTIDEVVTLASMIEREAATDDERGLVSSVFHNRINSKDGSMHLLQSCATVQYILKERKPVLSTADTQIKNPYNTYLNKGLPIGPIASPGSASIYAALYPEDTKYMFFVADVDGKRNMFAETYDGHLKNQKDVENKREKAGG